jgi:hypothetical protein
MIGTIYIVVNINKY